MQIKLDNSYYDYDRFRNFKPLTEYDDIEVGTLYHIPPTILYGRRDFIVETKDSSALSGQLKRENGEWGRATLYRSELSVKFLVKRHKI